MIDEVTRAALQLIFDKLQRAHALLQKNPPPPDMPVQVELLLEEATMQLRKVLGIHRWPQPTTERPDLETLEEWMQEDGSCAATDGCLVEWDGVCPHGHPSWLLRLGFI